jgi:hypothetical protein
MQNSFSTQPALLITNADLEHASLRGLDDAEAVFNFPLSHGVPRVDDRRVISGIIFVIRNGLRWCETPAEYGPSKTI